MASRLRVFLVGVTPDDLESLRRRISVDGALEIAGTALVDGLDTSGARVPQAIDAVVMSPAALARRRPTSSAMSERHGSKPDLIEALTSREHDVLALVADGYGNRDIAGRLGISEHTVKFHLTSIFGKLDASTRTEAVRRGLELGLIAI